MTLLEELKNHKKGDGKSFGLVVQGGGMKATYSADALASLAKHGLSESFDHIVGSSAGAINGAYFLAGDHDTYNSYIHDLSNKDFIDLRRKNKKVNIDFLVDKIMKQVRPVDLKKLRANPSQLHVLLTESISGKSIIASRQKWSDNIYEYLRATAALPYLYGKPTIIDGVSYIDGGVSNHTPIDVAIELGCTDIVVMLNTSLKNMQSIVKLHKPMRLITKAIPVVNKNNTHSIKRILPTNPKKLRENIEIIMNPPKSIRIYLLEPSDKNASTAMTSINRKKLIDLADSGVNDMKNLLLADA